MTRRERRRFRIKEDRVLDLFEEGKMKLHERVKKVATSEMLDFIVDRVDGRIAKE